MLFLACRSGQGAPEVEVAELNARLSRAPKLGMLRSAGQRSLHLFLTLHLLRAPPAGAVRSRASGAAPPHPGKRSRSSCLLARACVLSMDVVQTPLLARSATHPTPLHVH